MGDLWESEWLFVDILSVDFQCNIFTRFSFQLFSELDSIFEVLFVKRNRELV
jgi:hypothetical protein